MTQPADITAHLDSAAWVLYMHPRTPAGAAWIAEKPARRGPMSAENYTAEIKAARIRGLRIQAINPPTVDCDEDDDLQRWGTTANERRTG